MPIDLPPACAWRHDGSGRAGFEVCYPRLGDGVVLQGQTNAVADGDAWVVRYAIVVDRSWSTASAVVHRESAAADINADLVRDRSGRWSVDGRERPDLDGCVDLDLESSACTNTLPVHRLRLAIGQSADAPAAFVRADDLRVERLDQRYERLEDDGTQRRYAYRAPAFDVETVLVYDAFDLVVDYPGIAGRAL